MEAKDLRIGNWFLGDTEENNFQQITAKQILDFYDDPLDDYYKPIPLTEEWLLKFGLKPNQWFCSNSYCVVEDKTGDIHYGWCMKTQNSLHTKEIEFGYFKYVHQFQNLYFALTGEELTLKN